MKKDKSLEKPEDSVYINPLTDFGFKRIFTDKELIIAFLSDIVGTKITDLQYLDPGMLGNQTDERKAVFDLYCYTENEEYFIVEMQVARQTYFKDRALFYSSCAVRHQAPKGRYWNYKLKAVYFVGILNFSIFPEPEAHDTVIERVSLWRTEMQKPFSDKFTMIFVELSKFEKTAAELQSNTDKWLYLLKHLWQMKTPPAEITEKIFKRLMELAKIKSLTLEEMKEYKQSIMEYHEVQRVAEYALIEGMEKGMQKGREEGMEAKAVAFAQKLAQKGMNIIEIADLTDLPIEQVKAIFQAMRK
jgi:predicted transposase/invertase (TIGR01784 family)